MTSKSENKKSAIIFLILSLLAFGGLGLEMLLAFLIEPLIYGVGLNDFSTAQIITHWIATCFIWGIVACFLLVFAKKKYGFDAFSARKNVGVMNYLLCFVCLALSVTVSIIDWNGFKVIKEFTYNGWLKFIFQYIYYFFETILVYLIIIFAQEAGEKYFKSDNIPYGGIIAALTWGIIHWLTKGVLTIGLLSVLFALLFGAVYLLSKKNFYIAFPFIFLMLVL